MRTPSAHQSHEPVSINGTKSSSGSLTHSQISFDFDFFLSDAMPLIPVYFRLIIQTLTRQVPFNFCHQRLRKIFDDHVLADGKKCLKLTFKIKPPGFDNI